MTVNFLDVIDEFTVDKLSTMDSNHLVSLAEPLLKQMDVPSFKMDLHKQTNIEWLVRNLKVRNKTHKDYFDLQAILLHLAEKRNVLKAKYIEALWEELANDLGSNFKWYQVKVSYALKVSPTSTVLA